MINFLVIALFGTLAFSSLTYVGVDWSSVAIEEAAGYTYSNTNGAGGKLEAILESNGVNTVRQRLWYGDGDYDLQYNLELAQRAHAEGLQIYLDFHMSETWADPGHQTTPSAWESYNIEQLTAAVQNYTESTMNSFESAGIPLALVSIGNEITAGMLWPLGELSQSDGASNLATLLHAASAGIKASKLSTKPLIMIHLDNGWDWDTQEYWYDTVLGEGPFSSSDYDVQGVSYYPFYNSDATFASLKSSLTNMKSKYGKDVMVVETNWPTFCPDPEYAFPSDTTSIPFSAPGQTTWMTDVTNDIEAAGGNGLFYWEPAWINNAALGSSCANNLMFDSAGQALSSMEVFNSI